MDLYQAVIELIKVTMEKEKLTIRDISERTAYSEATVSRVLNRSKVSPEILSDILRELLTKEGVKW